MSFKFVNVCRGVFTDYLQFKLDRRVIRNFAHLIFEAIGLEILRNIRIVVFSHGPNRVSLLQICFTVQIGCLDVADT